jgi:hypothetical protein
MTGRSRARDRSRPSGGAPQTLASKLLAAGPCELCLLAIPSAIVTGTGVAQWTDQSGKGRHATQATGASQPSYTAITSAYGYVQGNGSQGLFVPSSGLEFLHSGAGATVVAIFEQSGTEGYYVCGNQVGSGANLGFSITRRVSPSARVAVGNGSAAVSQPDVAIGADGAYHKVVWTYRSGVDPDAVVRSDGVQIATSAEAATPSASTPAPTFGVCSGGTNTTFASTSKIRAIVAYSSVLSAGAISTIEALFTAQWGV